MKIYWRKNKAKILILFNPLEYGISGSVVGKGKI